MIREMGLVTALIEMPLEDGGSVVVEMEHASGGVVKAGRAEVAGRAAQSLESALDSVVPAARAVMEKVAEARPQSVTVEFGVKLSAGAGAVIARTSGECNFKVILRWDQRDGQPS